MTKSSFMMTEENSIMALSQRSTYLCVGFFDVKIFVTIIRSIFYLRKLTSLG